MPDQRIELYVFELTYADGTVDHGIMRATDKETARLHLEGLSLMGLSAIVVREQDYLINLLDSEYEGVAIFSDELAFN